MGVGPDAVAEARAVITIEISGAIEDAVAETVRGRTVRDMGRAGEDAVAEEMGEPMLRVKLGAEEAPVAIEGGAETRVRLEPETVGTRALAAAVARAVTDRPGVEAGLEAVAEASGVVIEKAGVAVNPTAVAKTTGEVAIN